MTAPPETYRRRRAVLASHLNRPIVIFGGQARAKQYPTNLHPFRAGSNYLYFGGPPVAGCALIIDPGSDGQAGCSLVRPVVGFDDMVWTGEPPSDDALAQAAGVRTSALMAPDQIGAWLSGRAGAYLAPPCPPTLEWAKSLRLKPAGPDEIQAVIDLRLIKDEHELKAMRFAAKVGVEAHRAAMRATKPGRGEADVAAAFLQVLTAHRCIESFASIVTIHGEVLHSEGNPNKLEAGRLLLMDAGVEEPGGYASDITRTYPVSGTFTPIQRQLYDVVLNSQRAAIAACVPGKRYREVHDISARTMCKGLVQADILKGDPADLAARCAHTLFFTHGVGHLIGLDVHDMEDFGDQAGYAPGRTRRPEFGNKFLRLDRDLQPGMTVTIEPGFYVVPAIWRNEEFVAPFAEVVNRKAVGALVQGEFGGIRIEETVHVRASGGPEVLSADLPNDAEAVAVIVRS